MRQELIRQAWIETRRQRAMADLFAALESKDLTAQRDVQKKLDELLEEELGSASTAHSF